ncbi:MAG: phosphoribosylglycinamide formyltransferase [Acidiferrobacterales bacterium]
MNTEPVNVVVLISGRGSNLQSIIDQTQAGELPIRICAVISNCADAYGLVRAQKAGITTHVLDHRPFASRDEYDGALRELIDRYDPQLVVLAGFMRVLEATFCNHYAGRLMNIHPSLLPAFPGLDTHERVLDAGSRIHGATVHFVVPEVDAGPIIVQATVPVLAGDTPERLAERVLKQEHRIFPLAIRWFAEGRLQVDSRRVLLDGEQHPEQGLARERS